MYWYQDKNRKPPCYKCDKRMAECHSTCEDYIAWKEAISKRHKKVDDDVWLDYKSQLFIKIQRGKLKR